MRQNTVFPPIGSIASSPSSSDSAQPPSLKDSDVSVLTPSKLISIDVVAQRLCCSTRHVRRLVDSGRIPRPIKLGALLRWVHADMDRWIADGCPAISRR